MSMPSSPTRTAALALLCALVIGCGGGTQPPAAFATNVCAAQASLIDTSGDWTTVQNALTANDFGTADAVIVTIGAKLDRTVNLLAATPKWDPGDQYVSDLSAAAGAYKTAAAAVEARDVSGVQTAMTTAGEQLTKATASGKAARTAGLSC